MREFVDKTMVQRKNHRKAIIVTAAIILTIGVLVGFAFVNRVDYPYTQEYIPGQGNIKGSVNVKKYTEKDPRFSIGANADGYVVFKNPDKAYDALAEEYPDAIEHI